MIGSGWTVALNDTGIASKGTADSFRMLNAYQIIMLSTGKTCTKRMNQSPFLLCQSNQERS